MAIGRNDFLWCSVVHLGAISLWLKVLLCLTRVLWRGWEPHCNIAHTIDSILLSDTIGKDSKGPVSGSKFNKLWVKTWTLSWLTLWSETLSFQFQNSWSELGKSTLSMLTLSWARAWQLVKSHHQWSSDTVIHHGNRGENRKQTFSGLRP